MAGRLRIIQKLPAQLFKTSTNAVSDFSTANLSRLTCSRCRRQSAIQQKTRSITTSATCYDDKIEKCRFGDMDLEVKPLHEFVFSKCDEFGNAPAIEDTLTGRKFTYHELKQASIRLASALKKLGVKKGDVIAVIHINGAEYPVIILATSALGAILTTVNPQYTPEEMATHLEHSEANMAVVFQPLVPSVQAAIKSKASLSKKIKEIIVIGQAEGCRPLQTLLEDDGSAFPENVSINPKEDVVIMPYSSGTTGLPKGVMLTHDNLVANIQQTCRQFPSEASDVSVAVLPFFHIFGIGPVQLGALSMGVKSLTLPKFEPEKFLQTLQDSKATFIFSVPPILILLAKHPVVSKFDLSNLKRVVSGAAPLGATLSEDLVKRFPNLNVMQGYGLTETSPVVFCDVLPATHGSAGMLIPNTFGKVIDIATGDTLGADQEGEICLKGPQIMKGYLKNQKATDEMIDKDGWLRSGDIGKYDKDGHFYVTDRLKELIKYKGYQVPPAELESLLLSHPSIQDAAVIGIPDEEAGELPRAYVVKKKDDLTDADIIQFVEDHVAPQKRLRGGVEFIDEVPKAVSGKILRRVLKLQATESLD